MNITCEAIRDLLPLYHDGICSDSSKELVDEHLRDCENCRKELDLMKVELATPHINPESKKSFLAVSSAWKKGKKKSFVKGALIAVLICVLLVGSFIGLTQWKCIHVHANDMEVTELSQLSDGSIVFCLISSGDYSSIRYTITDDGCFYLMPMRSIIELTSKEDRVVFGNYDKYYVFFQPGLHTSEPPYAGIFLPENITKIFVGPVSEGTLVWEYGMELPAASEAVEQIVINLH